VAGCEPRAERTDVLRRIGFVPQLPPPLRMPVGRLDFAATGGRRDGTDGACRALGLDPPLEAALRQAWRSEAEALIAIALGRACELLVMDEPAANLDPQARRVFFEVLAERQGRATMLISSHRIDEVAQLVSRVIELDQGKVVLDDRVDSAAALDTVLRCRIELSRASDAASAALRSWGLVAVNGGLRFTGTIAGPDRLRFLGALALSGLLRALVLEEPDGEDPS
jgi:ABC-2 type transport system ATP-binding protein